MVTGREAGLKKITVCLHSAATKYAMKIIITKTKVMRIPIEEGKVNITINGTKIEQIKSFKYLEHILTDYGRCETQIKCRIAQAKEVFSNRKELLTKGLQKQAKIKIV